MFIHANCPRVLRCNVSGKKFEVKTRDIVMLLFVRHVGRFLVECT